MTFTANDLRSVVTEITKEIEAEMLAAGHHVLPNGLVKEFSVRAFDMEEGRIRIQVSSSWGKEIIIRVKKVVGDKLQERFPEQRFVHSKTRGYKIWCLHFSDGNFNCYAAGIDWTGPK